MSCWLSAFSCHQAAAKGKTPEGPGWLDQHYPLHLPHPRDVKLDQPALCSEPVPLAEQAKRLGSLTSVSMSQVDVEEASPGSRAEEKAHVQMSQNTWDLGPSSVFILPLLYSFRKSFHWVCDVSSLEASHWHRLWRSLIPGGKQNRSVSGGSSTRFTGCKWKVWCSGKGKVLEGQVALQLAQCLSQLGLSRSFDMNHF